MSDQQNTQNLSPIKRALLEIRELKTKLAAAEKSAGEPIAIIGAGLRLPGQVVDLATFWKLLANGEDAICDIPPDRWDVDAFFDADPATPGKMYTRRGGFLERVDQFDPQFFGIAPREAISMDPQQRLVLQVGWEALENAGQSPDGLNGSLTGVFLGVSNNDYTRLLLTGPNSVDTHFATGNAFSVVAGRLSYLLGLQGPSVAVDTACSSSLVAIHLACQSLRSGESNLALAGGVNLILTPEMNINFSKAKMMAFDDRCKTFDAAADGYVRGEGGAIIVLKRLSDALADDDHILAVIRGSAVNQDGRSSGLTAPNGPSQEAVIRRALENAGVEPQQVDYLEAHGTGTSLGDPIEVQALAAVLGQNRPADRPLAIGSVKTNLGHLEAASGVAGLLKVVLALQHAEIPPHLHLKTLNPLVRWDKILVTVPTQRTPWPHGNAPRLAGVSSFGFSGTNAHVVLAEAPPRKKMAAILPAPARLLTLSARRPQALKLMAQRLRDFVSQTGVEFNNICATANAGRAHLPHRLAVTATSAGDLSRKLNAFSAGQETVGVQSGHAASTEGPEITFLFTGHGSQYVGMGRQLYQTHPVFRQAIDDCAALLESTLDVSLVALLYPSTAAETERADALMNTMRYAQPALFAVEYALAKLWQLWGVQPTLVMGHSLGEYVAACIAGVFSLADGLKLVAARGRLMDSLPQTGGMVTAFADEARIAEMIAPYADEAAIAVVNGPTHVVVSGTQPAIEAITAVLEAEEIKIRPLAVAQAAHSPVLDPILDEFEGVAAEITCHSPQIGLISAMTGQLVSAREITNAGYWRQHLRETVRFAAAMETLGREGQRIFIEVGPHPTLLGMGRRCLPQLEDEALWLPSLRQGQADWQELLDSLGTLYTHGGDINWSRFEQPYGGQKIPLPTYPWAEEYYWVENTRAPQPASPPTETGTFWESAVDAGNRQSQQGPLDLAMQTYPARWQTLQELTVAYICRALTELGMYGQQDEWHTADSLAARAGILPRYAGLIGRWQKHLADCGYLAPTENGFASTQPLPSVAPPLALEAAQAALSEVAPILTYVNHCGDKLADVLTGREDPLDTLFPEGGFETVDYLYHHWPVIRYYNGILAAVVDKIVSNHPVHQLRVLEIGAGTGGSTGFILPKLPADSTVYHFTDVSDLFLSRAQEKFSAYPFVQYDLLNIEKHPQAQGYQPHSFDVVIAANAIHATKNLAQALEHVRWLLSPGGVLLLLEGTNYLPWFDITTALIEGWERFDDDFRDDTPLLTPTQWQAALKRGGFERVALLPPDASVAEQLIHSVVMAQTAGSPTDGSLVFGADNATANQPAAAAPVTAHEPAAAALASQLKTALPDDRREMLTEYVRAHIARILRLATDHPLGLHDRLMDLGLDSLMAVELRGRLGKGLALEKPLPATLIFDYPTIEAVVGYLLPLFEVEAAVPPAPKTAMVVDTTIDDITDLSDDEIQDLLLKKLQGID